MYILDLFVMYLIKSEFNGEEDTIRKKGKRNCVSQRQRGSLQSEGIIPEDLEVHPDIFYGIFKNLNQSKTVV